jgi:hypothetical protein
MLEQKEITLPFTKGGQQFVIQQLPSSRGMQVATYLIQLFAGVAEGVGFTTANNLLLAPINPAAIIAGVIKRLHVDGTPSFIKRLVLESVISPALTEDTYESTFSGEYDALLTLVERIVEHNKYVEALKKRLAVIISLLSSDPPNSPTSTSSTSDPSSPSSPP